MDYLIVAAFILHYGFYVFFIMLFNAFIKSIDCKIRIKNSAMILIYTWTIAEFILLLLFTIDFGNKIWWIFLLGIIISFAISLSLRVVEKLDFFIWGMFSVLAPFIIVPTLIFLLANRKIYTYKK